jgi:thiol-disulfide isomerase/thioredoxin
MKRVRFTIESMAFLAYAGATCGTARADGAATPAPDPAAPTLPPFSRMQTARKHQHGIDSAIRLPANRPIEFKIPVLDGPDFRLTTLRGRVVFLNIFATWCGPCQTEQPELVAFAAEHADDTSVLGIIESEPDNDVRAYRKKYGITYPIGMDRNEGKVHAFFTDHPVFPTTVVIRPDGVISCAWEDNVDRAWLENERLTALALTTHV